MLTGALVSIPQGSGNDTELTTATWERTEEDARLKSVIQLVDTPTIAGEPPVNSALAIHQFLTKEPTLVQNDGKYRIEERSAVKTTWANIYILNDVIVVDSMKNRPFVRNIINNALHLPANTVTDVVLDVTKMARDHSEQWVRSFSDRKGKVDRGVVYGDGVETDAVFGAELDRSTSNSVGWTTDFFGNPTKVKVSPKGAVTVLAWPLPHQFLSFIETEILPYNALGKF